MLILTIILLISTTLLGGIFFVLFRWAVKDGQFDDPEEAKYVIFREHEADVKPNETKHARHAGA